MRILAVLLAMTTMAAAQELPSVPSNFDKGAWTLTVPVANPQPPGETVGAFRFICNASHNIYDDPIVYPKQPGVAHLHTFFGNTKADGNSTYASLRQSGESSCQGGPLNRSAYWVPAMLNGAGRIVMPDFFRIYYKGPPNGQTRKIPRGLVFLAGPYPGHPHALGTNPDGWPERPMWQCGGGEKQLTIPQNCAAGTIDVSMQMPECWDGVNLDSPTHRSHMSYPVRDNNTGRAACPATHPVILPAFSIAATYTTTSSVEANSWYLSSDRMEGRPHYPPGSSFHADWFGAWDDEVLDTWHANCIDKLRDGSAFNLCNGTMGRTPGTFKWKADPRLVDMPLPVNAGTPPHPHPEPIPTPIPIPAPPPVVVAPPLPPAHSHAVANDILRKAIAEATSLSRAKPDGVRARLLFQLNALKAELAKP